MGGDSSADSPENTAFKKSIIQDIKSNPSILFCYFGEPQSNWEGKYTEDKQKFLAVDSKLNFQLASEEGFEDMIKNAGAIVLSGGDAFVLIDKLHKYNLKEARV